MTITFVLPHIAVDQRRLSWRFDEKLDLIDRRCARAVARAQQEDSPDSRLRCRSYKAAAARERTRSMTPSADLADASGPIRVSRSMTVGQGSSPDDISPRSRPDDAGSFALPLDADLQRILSSSRFGFIMQNRRHWQSRVFAQIAKHIRFNPQDRDLPSPILATIESPPASSTRSTWLIIPPASGCQEPQIAAEFTRSIKIRLGSRSG